MARKLAGRSGESGERPAAALDAGQRRRWRWEEELTSGARLAATEKEERGRGSWAGGGEAGWAVGPRERGIGPHEKAKAGGLLLSLGWKKKRRKWAGGGK
jgi:hypothetical protein